MSKKNQTTLALIDDVFDHVLAPIRMILFPFNLLTKIWGLAMRAVWTLSNEYTKRLLCKCGKGVRIHGRLQITGPENVSLGDNIHINENAYIRAEGGLSIGDHTHISRNLVLYTRNHNYEGDRLPFDEKQKLKPVEIGRNVWIGVNVTITPGTTIGDGAIIGMGTTVSGNVPPLAIVGSAKQQIIKMRNEKHYSKTDQGKQHGGMSGRPWVEE